MTIQHAQINPSDIHVPYSFVYADAAARTAASGLVVGDIGKFARQLDDNTLWMLTAVTPAVTWSAIGSGGTSGDIFAANVVFEVTGDLISTTVQGALAELNNEKAPRSHLHMVITGDSNPAVLVNGVALDIILDNKVNSTLIGNPDGIASLDSTGKLVVAQIPAIAITDTFVVADETAMLALTAETGDVAIRTDLSKTFILKGDTASNLAHWEELRSPTTAVASDIPFTPTGDITSSNVQLAIAELDTEKIATSQRGVPGGVATLDPATGLVVELPDLTTDALTIPFLATESSHWVGEPPTNVANAINRLAAYLVLHIGSPIP